MKRNILGKYIVSVAFAIASGCNVALAVPAKPGLLTMRQADGTEIKVRLIGDEHAHYYLSEDGYLLVDDNDIFYYGNVDAAGNIVRSQIAARPVAARDAAAAAYLGGVDMTKVFAALGSRDAELKASRNAARLNALENKAAKAQTTAHTSSPQKARVGLFDTGFPSEGDQKGLVVLVEYQDVKFNLDDPYSYFSRMLNEDGFSDYGGTGCAAEYFRECSMNKFRPQFDVYGPITLSQNMSYYGGNDWSGDDKNPQKMAIEACQQLDATVDFSEYDRDGDGYIDNVFVFYAGRGEASGGGANTVWPHAWNVTAAEYTSYIFDGVQLDRYACTNEWEGSRPDGVGTFIHEFSHVMGLPDLYATSYTSAFTPGSWSVLDYGPYNNGGCTPPLYSAYERYSLGWMTPRVIDGPARINLNSISSNEACIIPTGSDYEFFLLENRQQTGWDAYIPGHGMLVWHVDYNESVWNRNVVNNTASHQYVDLEEADGTQNESSRAGDAFPGTQNVTSFTDDTRPSMCTWGGQKLELPLTDIAEADGLITFNVAGGITAPQAPVVCEATGVTPVSFIANWQTVEAADSYYLSVYTKAADDTKTYVGGYNRKDVGNASGAVVEGLQPLTTYYYTVMAGNEGELSDESAEIAVTSSEISFAYMSPVAVEATKISETSFTANWQPIEGAKEYTLTVYSKVFGQPIKDTVDFSDGVKNLPEGWKTNSTQSYANTAYSGNAIPSLRFIQTGNYIESPAYAEPVRGLSFWHRGSSASEENTITITAQTADSKWHEVAVTGVENNAGGAVTVIDDMPVEAYKIRIAYNMPGKGSLALDDIVVGWGGEMEPTEIVTKTVEAPAVSLDVDGLEPSTTYYYYVQAADGETLSKRSNEISVTTAGTNTSAVGGVSADRRAVVTVAGEVLGLNGVAGERVTVADVYGRTLFVTPCSAADRVEVRLPSRGIYMVKIGQSKTIKIKR